MCQGFYQSQDARLRDRDRGITEDRGDWRVRKDRGSGETWEVRGDREVRGNWGVRTERRVSGLDTEGLGCKGGQGFHKIEIV